MKKLLLITLTLLIGCSSSKISSDNVEIIPREKWDALPPKEYQNHIPERITIHHEGTIFKEDDNAPAHIKKVQAWGMSEARFWSDIPYHFLIDPKGNIYEGRNIFTAGETATEYDPSGHLLITCMGNFEEQEISDQQLNSLIQLIAKMCRQLSISPETIAAHKDFAKTACPGKNLYRYVENGYIKSEVKELLN